MTMKLLTPEQSKSDNSKIERERRERIAKLSNAETSLVSSINALKAKEIAEKERIAEELEQARIELKTEKETLLLEVTSLRSERKELMKPIKEIHADADRRLDEAKKIHADADNRESQLNERQEQIQERAESVVNKENEIQERGGILAKRENRIEIEEKRLKESSEKLAAKWAEYHIGVTTAERIFRQREADIEAAKKANDSIRESNLKESARLVEERRAVKDLYRALEEAKKHLGIK